jgi:hypothetical protein
MNTEIHEQLQQLAIKRTIPFCYNCYERAPSGRCEKCGSDDLMRELPGDGVEYGLDWVIKSILETELTPVNLEEEFEESVRQCYPETTSVGWMTFDTTSLMKDMDPVSWNCAQSEWESGEADAGTIISFDHGSTYYRVDDIEDLLQREG